MYSRSVPDPEPIDWQKSAKPAEKDYKLGDGAGLYLLVRPTGSKLWRFNYVDHGKYRTLAFGAWPDLGLADARGKRDGARRLIAAGLDRSHEEKVARAKACVDENDTFRSVAKEWVSKNEREGMAEITLSKIRWQAYPKIGSRPISKITAQEGLAVLRSVEATGRYESARRMRSVLGRVFRDAVATAWAERDPAGDLRGALTVPKTRHLAAITTASRAGELTRAIEGYTGHAITTASRAGELTRAIEGYTGHAITLYALRLSALGSRLSALGARASSDRPNGASSISIARSGTCPPRK